MNSERKYKILAAIFYGKISSNCVQFYKQKKALKKQKHTIKSTEALLLGIPLLNVLWVRMQVYTLGH